MFHQGSVIPKSIASIGQFFLAHWLPNPWHCWGPSGWFVPRDPVVFTFHTLALSCSDVGCHCLFSCCVPARVIVSFHAVLHRYLCWSTVWHWAVKYSSWLGWSLCCTQTYLTVTRQWMIHGVADIQLTYCLLFTSVQGKPIFALCLIKCACCCTGQNGLFGCMAALIDKSMEKINIGWQHLHLWSCCVLWCIVHYCISAEMPRTAEPQLSCQKAQHNELNCEFLWCQKKIHIIMRELHCWIAASCSIMSEVQIHSYYWAVTRTSYIISELSMVLRGQNKHMMSELPALPITRFWPTMPKRTCPDGRGKAAKNGKVSRPWAERLLDAAKPFECNMTSTFDNS